MNCLFETMAGAYMAIRSKIVAPPVEEEMYSAHDNLERCKSTMEKREREFTEEISKLEKSAICAKQRGDLTGF